MRKISLQSLNLFFNQLRNKFLTYCFLISKEMNKPYIKKHSEISGFTIWIVDGKYIRDNIDIEFTNYGQNYMFKFIPKNEMWLDQERNPDEDKYYINSMLRMNKFLSQKISHREAIKQDDIIEKEERTKNYPEEILKNPQIVIENKSIYRKLLKKYSKKIKVWIVNGKTVRDLFEVQFTEGGHEKVYSFIPKDEVWIDDDLNRREIKAVLLHEMHERKLMMEGGEYIRYDITAHDAHKDSSRIEYYYRRNPKELDKKLKEAIDANNK